MHVFKYRVVASACCRFLGLPLVICGHPSCYWSWRDWWFSGLLSISLSRGESFFFGVTGEASVSFSSILLSYTAS